MGGVFEVGILEAVFHPVWNVEEGVGSFATNVI